MANNLLKRIVMILMMSVLSFSLFAFEKKFEQKLSWKGDENAFEYKVEIAQEVIESDEENSEKPQLKIIKSVTTTESFITVNLNAGHYKYRVIAYDFLQRESSVTEWRNFEVIKALEPELELAQKEIEVKKYQRKAINVPVDMKQITAESKVEIINEETGEVIEGKVLETETEEGFKVVEFPKVIDGDYKIKVTNPSGLSTVTEESVTIKTEVKEKKKIDWPIDLNIMAGAGFRFAFENELNEFGDEKGMPLAIEGKISYFPFELAMFDFGFEADFDMLNFSYSSESAEINFRAYDLIFSLAARINFMNDKLNVCLKAGAGVSILQKNIDINLENLSPIPDKTFGYLCFKGGLGVQYIPFKHLILEAGADYTMIFIPDLQMNYITPYICIGLRL